MKQYKQCITQLTQVHILVKLPHDCQNTHTLQNPHVHTPAHCKSHAYAHIHPYITKQDKTTTVQDTHQMK